MNLAELEKLEVVAEDDEYKVSVKFDHIEKEFTETDRNLVLYSKIHYQTRKFEWDATMATVKIPYRDPALGFMLGGVVFSSVGIYQRAPGVVVSKDKKAQPGFDDQVDIVTSRNTTLGIVYKRNGVMIKFRKGGKDRFVPIGIFLKAFSGLPYKMILDRFAFKPLALLNSFPCEVHDTAVDLAKVPSYGLHGNIDEPPIDECVRKVYEALMQQTAASSNTNYSVHWKASRIQSYFAGLHFKTVDNYESNLSLHSRAIGTKVDEDISVPSVDEDGNETVFTLKRGDYINEAVAEKIRWHNISQLRVKYKERSFILQEDTPPLFRALGYRLATAIPSLGYEEGTLITKEVLKNINKNYPSMTLEVCYGKERLTLTKSGNDPELGDFITILNVLFTAGFREYSEASQYEVANRIIITYDKQVYIEAEQTYQEIVDAIAGCTSLQNILKSLPRLPSLALENRLRDAGTKELAQAEITNIMSRAIAENRASALMKSAPAAMTAVQKGQYARIDSLHSPESDKVGAVQQLTYFARVNPKTGEIEAPYEVVRNGRPTGEVEWISAAKESNKYIVGWDENLQKESVMARYNGDVTTVDPKQVHYRDVSPFCDMSVSRATIPFPEFSQPRRSLMATKMSGQAVPLLFPERPIVSTGADTEIPCLYYTARQIVESSLGADALKACPDGKLQVLTVKWAKTCAVYTCFYNQQSFTFSVPFLPTDKETLYNYNLNYKEDYLYDLDDVVFYNQSCDMKPCDFWSRIEQGTLPLIKDIGKPALALGVNLRVMYKTYMSSTVDDAVVISDRLVKNKKLSSIQIFKYSYTLKMGETLSTTDGLAKLHSYVYRGQPVITVTKVNGNPKHVYASQSGEVIMAELVNEDHVQTAEVWVATFHDAEVGDKVAGRYGNKSVIAKIIPEYEMPYDPETGETADIICSPLGIPSRMNLGQLVEVTLGAVMAKEGKHAVVTPFYPGIKKEVEELYAASGLKQKRLYHPAYGKFTERPVMLGTMYFLKLEQMSNIKWSAVGVPTAVDPVFGQPVSSVNTDKGQSMEEMITWALAAAGAKETLKILSTLYSSDELSRREYFKVLECNDDRGPGGWDERVGEALKFSQDNKDALVTQTIMRMFGLELVVKSGSNYELVPLKLDDIVIEVPFAQFKQHNEPVGETDWCKVKLQAPVVSPFWIEDFPLHIVLGVKSVRGLVSKTYYLNPATRVVVPGKTLTDFERSSHMTGMDAVIWLLRNTTVKDALARLQDSAGVTMDADVNVVYESFVDSLTGFSGDENKEDEAARVELSKNVRNLIRFLERMQAHEVELSDLVWDYMPILPKVFRQSTMVRGVETEHPFFKQLRYICGATKSDEIYQALRQFIGFGEAKSGDLMSLRGYFFGKGSQSGQHGTVRGNVLSKRVGFSGRAVIVPSTDMDMSPFFIGIPWHLAMIELARPLSIRLMKRAVDMSHELHAGDNTIPANLLTGLKSHEWEYLISSLGSFNSYVFNQMFPSIGRNNQVYLYNFLRKTIREICEGKVSPDGRVRVNGEWRYPEELPPDVTIDAAVVLAGRQPTLHKKSLRCFFMKLVDGYSAVIHPLVCAGFNADFDGDTMWHVQLLGEIKNECWKTVSVLQDLISEKDGSYTLGLLQDSALGVYCASIFKDNKKNFEGKRGQYYVFDSADALQMQLEYGNVNYYDAVVFIDRSQGTSYISTAGRILLNARVPGALTKVPFTDKWGICEQVLGKEYIPQFCQLKYDTVWVATGIRPHDRPDAVKIEKVLLDTYDAYGARESVLTAQALYEIGLAAADLYSVSASMEDMSVDVDIEQFMDEPKQSVNLLNKLERLGLISEEERKASSIKAWERARKAAMDAVIKAIPENSNTHFMMYSGARGKPDQVMQSVGFIGTIAKTATSDIEYPILRGYGSGLSSLDLYQTCFTARMGVVSTQTGTKDTGYATRQTVYMSSGMCVKEDDCGIQNRVEPVLYDSETSEVVYPDGRVEPIDSLIGQFVDPSTEQFELLSAELNKTGYMINESILVSITSIYKLSTLKLLDGEVSIRYKLNELWRQRVLEDGYSYALPFTVNRKITEASLDWVERHGLKEIIMFDQEASENESCFDLEAYLPVDYDSSQYSLFVNGQPIDEEMLYGKIVHPWSERFKYYEKLLDDQGRLTVKAMRYLTACTIRSIELEGVGTVRLRYKLTKLFRELVLGRVATSLAYLDGDSCITEATLNEVELCQLEAIPVRTLLTCLTESGACSTCRGKSPSTKKFNKVGDNLGIAAAQAQCEPLSQATLDVNHSAGKRSLGVGLVSGLDYYKKLISGNVVPKDSVHLVEKATRCSGYVVVDKSNENYIKIVDEQGHMLQSWNKDKSDQLLVPDGAYVDAGTTVISGLPNFDRFRTRNVFKAALSARYTLLREYYLIFHALNVSPRNYEILAREQTSICYLADSVNKPPTKDVAREAKERTMFYELRLAKQSEVVNKYSGVAGFAFENVTHMLVAGALNSEGLPLNSVLGNLVTGTPVGSETAWFIPKRFCRTNQAMQKSTIKLAEEKMKAFTSSLSINRMQLGGASQDSEDLADSLINMVLSMDSELNGDSLQPRLLPGLEVEPLEVEIPKEEVPFEANIVDVFDDELSYESAERDFADLVVIDEYEVDEDEETKTSDENSTASNSVNRLSLD